MSRTKSRIQTEICGDCGGSDPSWASINRGILLCADCCSIHRSLGRHISQVKSLRQGTWSPSVLAYVNQLNIHGANSVWEHLLLDSVAPKNLKRKPSPKDPLHPTKADFIRAKHVNLSYVLKPSLEDAVSPGNLEVELSKQLHASVRSANLETSLRLLVQGADPNYFHDEKGSTPLHVAVRSGQLSQMELLLVYGADMNTLDSQGNTPLDVAQACKQMAIAERLVEAMYEVTDRLSYFLVGKKPDHSSGQHLLIPDQSRKEISEQLKIARGKLQLVPNRMFEELVMDLYDEVDRRETEAIWATSSLNPEIGAVPFLPTNPHLSATRNQGRQKLARFSQQEFSGLISDVLIDARRRQNMANLRPIDSPLPASLSQLKNAAARDSNLSDDEPLYDAVASDDDYAALAPVAQQSPPSIVSNVDVETLRQQLQHQESTIQELRVLVQKLTRENSHLKSHVDSKEYEVQLRIDGPDQCPGEQEDSEPTASDGRQYCKRPVSMYEARQQPREENRPPITQSLYSMASLANANNVSNSTTGTIVTSTNASSDSNAQTGNNMVSKLPQFEEVKKRTDLVARRIKELFATMQDLSKTGAFVPCAERIRIAVVELTAIFPATLHEETLRSAMKQLNYNTNLIQTECTRLQRSLVEEGQQMAVLSDSIKLNMEKVRGCAYNLAMSTKILITHFQQS
ncbi:ARF GTPase-activating protein Git isoform X2 [Toxorhynchites rutilus septentrionalis]|uniref:ARF GTPase-activating protein Git isoform X2 n=1 Tax=Toxorhynchites rutilus septentrionalis TaxID=329112 RepID=UPI00247970B5|nr:ARF GTPase-activating protein Git isoform X2 [Toxorhynchites rutilus septentrionalis]